MFKDMSPQYIQGEDAWANMQPLSSNPYSPETQPVFYSRWREGWKSWDKFEDVIEGVDI